MKIYEIISKTQKKSRKIDYFEGQNKWGFFEKNKNYNFIFLCIYFFCLIDKSIK
jgi:hypothetical protein